MSIRKNIVATFLVTTIKAMNLLAQSGDPSLIYYQRGVEEFSKRNYVKADSLFSISIMQNPHKDTYFNRAANYRKLGNGAGYCKDLSYAALMGDLEAHGIFCKECGKADTTYYKNGLAAPKEPDLQYRVRYKLGSEVNKISALYTGKGTFIKTLCIETGFDTIITNKVSRTATFPGGMKNLGGYFFQKFQFPVGARRNEIRGKIKISCQINKFGYPENVMVLSGIDDCENCSDEAIRVINKMPRWQPAINGGRCVNSIVHIPIIIR